MTQGAALFKIDLRIDQKMISLKVHEEDAFQDLIERLVKSVTWKSIPKDKIKGRLEAQFRKILEGKLSTRVRNKLTELVEESNLVILNIDTTKN